MSLKDAINRYKEVNSNNSDNYDPTQELRNKTILRAGAKNQKVMVRILPPANSENLFYTEFRQWFTSASKKSGGEFKTAFTLSSKRDENDPIQAYIDRADKVGLIGTTFSNSYPSKRYYVNVVPLQYTDGKIIQATIPDGLPNVYVMELSKSQMDSLMSSLEDPMSNPNVNQAALNAYAFTPSQDQKDWSFISSGLAYPIQISYVKESNNHVHYDVKIAQNYPLPPLPTGWENQLEDLNKLIQPSYITNPSIVQYVLNQKNAELAAQPAQQPQTSATQAPSFKDTFSNSPIFGSIPTSQAPTQPVAPQAVPQAKPTQAPAQQPPVQQQQVSPQSVPRATPEEQQEIEDLGNPLSQFGSQMQPKQEQPVSQAPAPQQPVPADKHVTDASVKDVLNDSGLGDVAKELFGGK